MPNAMMNEEMCYERELQKPSRHNDEQRKKTCVLKGI